MTGTLAYTRHDAARSARMLFLAPALVAALPFAAPVMAGPKHAAADPWQHAASADRPGAATPPSVMDPGVFQIETSFESQKVRPTDADEMTTNDFPTLLRYGVVRDLEIRLESNTVSVEQAVTGFADMSVEAKWLALDRAEGAVPSIAFLPSVSLPTGSSDFTAGKTQAGLAALLGWTLHSGTSFSFDMNATHAVEDVDSPYEWQVGSQAAFQVPLQRHWAVSGDTFVTVPLVNGSSAPWGVDGGVEYYPNPDTQLDCGVIQTFTEPGTATAFQLGFSRRIGY